MRREPVPPSARATASSALAPPQRERAVGGAPRRDEAAGDRREQHGGGNGPLHHRMGGPLLVDPQPGVGAEERARREHPRRERDRPPRQTVPATRAAGATSAPSRPGPRARRSRSFSSVGAGTASRHTRPSPASCPRPASITPVRSTCQPAEAGDPCQVEERRQDRGPAPKQLRALLERASTTGRPSPATFSDSSSFYCSGTVANRQTERISSAERQRVRARFAIAKRTSQRDGGDRQASSATQSSSGAPTASAGSPESRSCNEPTSSNDKSANTPTRNSQASGRRVRRPGAARVGAPGDGAQDRDQQQHHRGPPGREVVLAQEVQLGENRAGRRALARAASRHERAGQEHEPAGGHRDEDEPRNRRFVQSIGCVAGTLIERHYPGE